MESKASTKINLFAGLLLAIINPVIRFFFPPFGEYIDRLQWRGLPIKLLGVYDYVELRRKGIISKEVYQDRLLSYGINPDEAELLYLNSERLADIGDLIELRVRGKISQDEYLRESERLGFSRALAEKIFSLRESLLPPEVVIKALWRGLTLKGSRENLIEELKKQGWTEEKIEILEKVSRFYPSPDDFIRFMVRETFNEEVVKKYGYDEGYPKAIEEYVAKAGMDPVWMRHYWRAHWQLPSPQMGFEMLARGLITLEDLKTLFIIADYPPFWIDKLIKIAYQPYTRVDIRRMHKLGVLTRDQVKRAYMDLGYDEEKAEALTKFTEALNREEEKEEKKEITEPTRSAILEQYEAKLLSREEAKSMLIQTGLAEDVAEFYLALKDYEIEKKRVSKYVEAIRKLYLNDVIDEGEVATIFNKLGLPVDMIDETLTLWDLEKMGKVALPSKTDLLNWLKKGKITEDEFKMEMSKLGYNQRYIDLYLSSVK